MYGLASATELIMTLATDFDPDMVVVIARLGMLGSLSLFAAFLASMLYVRYLFLLYLYIHYLMFFCIYVLICTAITPMMFSCIDPWTNATTNQVETISAYINDVHTASNLQKSEHVPNIKDKVTTHEDDEMESEPLRSQTSAPEMNERSKIC